MKTTTTIFKGILVLLMLSNYQSFAQSWSQVWVDDFNGTGLSGDWVIETGTGPNGDGWGNNELQYYRAENIAVAGGALQITARRENYGGREYTSGRIKTQGRKSFKYGKMEARIAMPNFQGVWPAFWMLGDNITSVAWPSCGEIDIMEHINTGDGIFGTIHWSDGNGNYANYTGNTTANSSINNYHTYHVEWDASLIKWFIDGVKYHEVSIQNGVNGTSEFHQNYFFLLNMAIGGKWPGFTVDNAAFPKTMYVDYVKVSQASTGGVATVYRDCSFGGTAVGLPVGDYNLSQMNARGIYNDDISSLRVSGGYEVVLYEHDNFGGASRIFTGDDDCLVDNGINDWASSMRVRTRTSSNSTKIEAESFIAMSGIQTETCYDQNGGLNVGWIDAGDWMAYNINISTSGTYRVTYRVATPNSGKTLRFEKDNGATLIGTVSIPNTGGWQNWQNAYHDVYLPAGSYSVGIATGTGGFNLNYFTIGSPNARLAAPEVQVVSKSSGLKLYPNPVIHNLHVDSEFSGMEFQIINAQGREIISGATTSEGIDVSQLKQGIYTILINENGKKVTKQFIKN